MKKSKVADLIVQHVPKQLIMALSDAIYAASKRSFDSAKMKNQGHRATALGLERYLNLNETIHEVFEANGCNPGKLCGNRIVEGRSGIFTIARESYNDNQWKKLFRSKRKQTLISENVFVEKVVQPDLFSDGSDVPKATLFVVCRFSGSLQTQPEAPMSVELVVPSSDGKSWVFHEPLELFLTRYDVVPSQEDNAFPGLKKGIIKKDGTEDDDV
ncbi:hypothetical protein FQG30_08810 [Escherichia coli]|uniref:hypothetical protein n=1 Tax=Enterobacteriaceae TaxID=543 RepID=UPI0010645BC6|nr:hypothetical protein [Raoultella planticola]EFN4975875.1 hypothetical protein [Escherichia coli]ELA2169295.1 hypothetical protein [Klebsiella aerogenes]HDX8934688.1 hypothetical protein [Klebsiella oxytoca]TDV06671.1 hypothetical protein DFO76_105379 [Raoultella planticola]TDX34242.1 hypothetical protein DET60_11343 [Raoultella planticola]